MQTVRKNSPTTHSYSLHLAFQNYKEKKKKNDNSSVRAYHRLGLRKTKGTSSSGKGLEDLKPHVNIFKGNQARWEEQRSTATNDTGAEGERHEKNERLLLRTNSSFPNSLKSGNREEKKKGKRRRSATSHRETEKIRHPEGSERSWPDRS